jgi:centromeric protein E
MAYDLTATSLSLSAEHPNVKKRGGKSGREAEYDYEFGESRLQQKRQSLTPVDALLTYPDTTPVLYNSKIAPLVNKAMNGFNSTIFA